MPEAGQGVAVDLLDESLKLLAGRLQLDRPLVFFDLEGTGTNPIRDRICQIGVLKLLPDGTSRCWASLVNPEMPMPAAAQACHGITDEALVDAPTFRVLAPNLADSLAGCALAALNGRRYDVELLACEFGRVTIPWGPADPKWTGRVVDPYLLWVRREPRNLAAYAEKFGGVKRADGEGHRADQDVTDLVIGFAGQLMADPTLPSTVADLVEACRDPTWIDPDGKIRWQDGVAVLGFGKQAGVPLHEVPRDYFGWMLKNDFPPPVKAIVRDCLRGIYPTPSQEGTTE